VSIPSWVLDSSIALAWVVTSQATPTADNLAVQVKAGATLIVPLLWFSETANALLLLQRRKLINQAERRRALELLAELPILVDNAPPYTAFHDTFDLAERYGLTIYYATYLEIATRRQAAIATRDGQLHKAAQECGLTVL
jgi:predicted nucleic acid-binding protein